MQQILNEKMNQQNPTIRIDKTKWNQDNSQISDAN